MEAFRTFSTFGLVCITIGIPVVMTYSDSISKRDRQINAAGWTLICMGLVIAVCVLITALVALMAYLY